MKPIRILHVFGRMNRGGAETIIMDIYRKLDKTKIQFDFIVHTNELCDFDDEILSLGGNIYRVPRYNILNHLQYIKVWKKFFKVNHEKYSFIHGHIRSTASIYLKIAKSFEIETIMHSHAVSSGLGFSSKIKDWMQRKISDYSDYMFACSYEAGLWLFGKENINSNRFIIVKNAIDLNRFKRSNYMRNRIRNDLKLSNQIVLGHVGRFHPLKNHDFLIDVFNEYHKRNNNSVLLLIGVGPLMDEIKRKVENLGLSDYVYLLGLQENIEKYLNAMDVFVFPSISEGLGISLIEAQAVELTCVVSDTIPEEAIISKKIIKKSLSDHPKSWADSIEGSLLLNVSENISCKLEKNGYDINTTTQWLTEFYFKKIKTRKEMC